MQHIRILVLALLVLLGACKKTAPAEFVATPPAIPAALVSPSSTCPAANFDGFLKAFIDSEEVQKYFTSAPLESQTVDAAAEPEPALITKMLPATELQFPLIPGEQQQIRQGLKMRQSVLENGDTKVTLAREDTDYQMSFYFKKGACWKLIRIRNDSL